MMMMTIFNNHNICLRGMDLQVPDLNYIVSLQQILKQEDPEDPGGHLRYVLYILLSYMKYTRSHKIVYWLSNCHLIEISLYFSLESQMGQLAVADRRSVVSSACHH